MSEPKIGGTKPVFLELAPGSYWWCTCGHSADQPWCDGSHKEHGFEPMELSVDEEKKVALCTCKRTGNPPFCDGSHKRL